MFRRLRSRKGQNTLEYALLIAIVVGALIAMQRYIKRGVEGGLKGRADEIGEQFDAERTNGSYTTTSSSRTHDTFTAGVTRSELLEQDVYEKVTNSENMTMQ